MSVVDTSTWKPFRVGDLFDVTGSKTTPKNALHLDDAASYPYVTTQATDNGVFSRSDKYTEDGNVLTVDSAVIGSCFYQAEPFTASDHVEKLVPRFAMSDNVGLFLSCVMTKYAGYYDYSYAQKRSQTVLRNEVILLPATPDGEPDWAYMETYMQQVLDREEMFAEHLASLTAEAVADGHVVDTSAWKAFKMTDGLGFVCHHGSRLNKSARIDGDIPFVTAGFENRGVSQFIGNDVAVYSDAITVDMFGNCFFQQGQCAGDDNVYFFVNNAISHYCKLFLSSAIYASVANRFDYSSQFRQSDADSLSVFLPVTSDGVPDWAYMEQYMKDVTAVEVLFADELDRVYRE